MSASHPVALEARDWGWRYATRHRWAVRGATLSIRPGERVLLLGASGSGKSTLLQGFGGVLGGADEGETEGELLVDGRPATQARGRIGMVLQDPDTQTILARVGDDVAFGCENLGVPRERIPERVRDALDAVGLDLPLDRPTSALSGGQKQRLALAGVLAMGAGAVLLDEPTANLDPGGVQEVRDAVGAALAASGATLVVIEHRVDVWLPLVDRVIVLGPAVDGTEVIADGPPQDVLGARADELAAMGVWIPGRRPRFPGDPAGSGSELGLDSVLRPVSAPNGPEPAVQGPEPAIQPEIGTRSALEGEVLLRAEGLIVGRVPGSPVAGPFDLTIRAGEVLGITGPNGAGKSTLGLTLAGLLPAQGGALRAADALRGADGPALRRGASGRRGGRRSAVDPADPFAWTSGSLLTRIGAVLQTPEHQLLGRTVREELAIGPRALRLDEAEVTARVDDLLGRLRLDALGEANPYTLSGGEKRRLTVAAALATRPRILVLDEPTFGQDAVTWTELVALIAGIRDAGTAIVAVTHDDEVLRALDARRLEVGR